MPETLVITIPVMWSAGMELAYWAFVVLILYALWRWVIGLTGV